MKLPFTFLAVCAVSTLMISLPAPAQGQSSSSTTEGGKPSPSPVVTHTTTTPPKPTTVSTTQAQPTTNPVVTSRITTTRVNTAIVTSATLSSAALPTSTGLVPPPTNGTCVNSSTCEGDLVCVASATDLNAGTCQAFKFVCQSNPPQSCVTSADCSLAYSLCAPNDNGQMVCTGRGMPGTASECKDPVKDDGVMKTLKYAGIAVGCVAASALLFVLVRWKRRSQRSGVPAEMFGAMDYGMNDRGGSSGKAESYPFSSRPNAHGNDVAPSPLDYNNNSHSNNNGGGYDNQYYEEPVGYTKQDQYYNHDQYDNGYGGGGGGGGGGGYGQGGGGGYNNGYNNAGYGHGGGGDGYYDNGGYDNYQQHPTSPAPAARVASPRHQNLQMDNYGAEPSELDFGGRGGQGGHAGYGGGRY